jgi:hypothetical protein
MSTFCPTARATVIEFVSELRRPAFAVGGLFGLRASSVSLVGRAIGPSRRRADPAFPKFEPIHLHGTHNKSITSLHEEIAPRNHASTQGVDTLCQIALSRIWTCVANIKPSRRAAQTM